MNSREQRRVIAVVTDSFAPFHREVLDGLWPHFSAAGYGTLAVAGRDVRTDRLIEAGTANQEDGHRAFGTGLDVRGAVIVCGATPPDMPDAAIADYVAAVTDGPVVSLGIGLPGVASVTIAWDDAIAELMAHMVRDAGRRRFVFIRGYVGDPHSKHREAGFRAGMAAAGLEVDEQLVVSGSYSVADSMHAVIRLLDEGHRFDGIVAANDDMAIGAIGALTNRGIRVPEDVVVAGFDDSLASFNSHPPLTTVLLDTQRLAASTAELLLGAVETGVSPPPDLEVQIESGLIRRASSRHLLTDPKPTIPEAPDELAPHLVRRIVDRWEAHRAPERLDIVKLAESVVATMMTGDDSFANARRKSYDDMTWYADRSEADWLRHASRELVALTVEVRDVLPAVGLQAMVADLEVLDHRLLPSETLNAVARTSHRQLQERLVMRLASCSDPESLWDVLRSGLRSLGMTNAWVAANAHGGTPGADDQKVEASTRMRLLFSLANEVLGDDESFARASVLPERYSSLLESGVHVLVPLRAGENDIGYLVVELRGEYLLELEAVASGIAQVLRHVNQVDNLERQASHLRVANEALDRLARHDSLTGLANRKLFLERLEQEIDQAGPDDQLSILFVDLDGFKLINDTLGHEAGDQLLRVTANRLAGVLAETDTLARLGGDEFTVVLRHPMGSSRAADVAGDILSAAAQPFFLEGETIRVSASVGIAQYPNDGRTTHVLTRNADNAMYAAKSAGKNRFAHYEVGLALENELEFELREALRLGLERDEFDLEFQPRICLETGEVQAFEALLRWNPNHDVAVADRQPDRFILVAERSGLISALDSFSLNRACQQASRWVETCRQVPISVNMSVVRMQEANIVTQVVAALEAYNLPPELLELEISEQALLSDVDASIATLSSLREIGVRCSMDDFGTGTSSVADLAKLPLDMLKIDGSLIAGIHATSDSARTNLRAIVALGSSLGLSCVAEGIETPEQRRFLLEIGCQQGQGFMFSEGLEDASAVALAAWRRLSGDLDGH